MSMTQASSEYFQQVAGSWDQISAGYFGKPVCDAVQENYVAVAKSGSSCGRSSPAAENEGCCSGTKYEDVSFTTGYTPRSYRKRLRKPPAFRWGAATRSPWPG